MDVSSLLDHASTLPGSQCQSIRARMAAHGHAQTDRRHLHLHRVAMEKLRRNPELRRSCLALVEQWLGREEHNSSAPYLVRWREILSDWTLDEVADLVLDPDEGQTLRQCSPLGPALTPQERWAALEEIDGQVVSAP